MAIRFQRGETPLRIGIDVRKADPGSSGQARYVWRLGAWLAEQGHEVHYITVRDLARVTTPPGTTLHHWKDHGPRRLASAVAGLGLSTLLINPERSRRYRRIRANVLRPGYGTDHYSQKLDSFHSLPGVWARRLLRITPWVLAERLWERRFYEDPSPPPHVIAVSRYMRDQVLTTYDVPPEHVHVVHNGIDLNEFSPKVREASREARRREWGVPPSATCLLFMGHNFRLKGLWDLIEVTRHMLANGRDVHLLVAGTGTGRGQVRKARRLVAGRGLEPHVTLLGDVQPATEAFAAADVFFHLSWHDAFGFVVLEAMACGLPVVTTPRAGAAEVVTDGVSGILVDPDDPARIARRAEGLIDRATREAMGERALEVARRHPEEENFRQVLHVLERAAATWERPVR